MPAFVQRSFGKQGHLHHRFEIIYLIVVIHEAVAQVQVIETDMADAGIFVWVAGLF